MKTLFLVILYTNTFTCMINVPVLQTQVSSPEAAAIILWEEDAKLGYVEPGHNHGHLYELNFDNMTISEVPIPKMIFKSNEVTE